ncbi:hypothetical protein [Streptomyces sp. NPDC002540]
MLIDIYGSSRDISTLMGSLPRAGLRQHPMWNFPDPIEIGLKGTPVPGQRAGRQSVERDGARDERHRTRFLGRRTDSRRYCGGSPRGRIDGRADGPRGRRRG